MGYFGYTLRLIDGGTVINVVCPLQYPAVKKFQKWVSRGRAALRELQLTLRGDPGKCRHAATFERWHGNRRCGCIHVAQRSRRRVLPALRNCADDPQHSLPCPHWQPASVAGVSAGTGVHENPTESWPVLGRKSFREPIFVDTGAVYASIQPFAVSVLRRLVFN